MREVPPNREAGEQRFGDASTHLPPFRLRNAGYNSGMIEAVAANTKLHRRFCEAVRTRRLELGLTQAVVAQRLGISVPTYSAIENGRASPSLDQVERVAKALECDGGDLLTLEKSVA